MEFICVYSCLFVVHLSLFVIFLQGFDGPVAGFQGFDGVGGGVGGGHGGGNGDFVHHGGGADGAFVGFGAFGGGGVDDELHLLVFDGIDDVGAAFLDFVDAGGGDS